MTNLEFSNQFDTMLSSYSNTAKFGEDASKQEITLDEYEKSVFLTKAQKDLVISLYTGKNSTGEAFESTEELRRYLSNLVGEVSLQPITNSSGLPLGVSGSSTFFTLPEDLWFITMEQVVASNSSCGKEGVMKVYPVKQDEYQSLRDNPFRGANRRRALRLDLAEGNVEIISKYNVTTYYVRYLKKLSPIILVDLPDDLSIEDISKETECKLHEALHYNILERAVALAIQSKTYGATSTNRES